MACTLLKFFPMLSVFFFIAQKISQVKRDFRDRPEEDVVIEDVEIAE